MAQVIVRNLEDDVKVALKQRATRHGSSMEEEARFILRRAVNDEASVTSKLGPRIAGRFADVGLAESVPELRGQPIAPMCFGA